MLLALAFFMQQSSGAHSVSPNHQGQTLLNSDAAVLNVESIILTSAEFADDFISPKAEETVALAGAKKL